MAAAQPLTDHDQIREWAEERGGRPACVKGTGGRDDTGMIRLDFPGYSGAESLQPISWDEWFRQFDENNLALMVQETTSGGEQSNFNKLVSRKTVRQRRSSRKTSDRSARSSGARKTGSRKSAGRKTARRSASAAGTASRGKSSARKRTGTTRAARSTSRRSASKRTGSPARKTAGGRRKTAARRK